MKIFISLGLMLSSIFLCFTQENVKAWLPNYYIESVVSNDTINNNYLFPVEGIEIIGNFKKINILLFKSEINQVKFKKVKINDQIKYQIFNLKYFVNLKYNDQQLIDKFSVSKVYISLENMKIVLEIVNPDNIITDKIYFVDHCNSYYFESIYDTKKYLISLIKK